MRANKKIFWISVIVLAISASLIIVAQILLDQGFCSGWNTTFDIIKNISISLLGGAFLSVAVSYIQFRERERELIIQFSKEARYILGRITKLMCWFHNEYYHDTIKYSHYNNLPKISKTPTKAEEKKFWAAAKADAEKQSAEWRASTEKVKDFYEIAKSIDPSDLYAITDDFCGLWILGASKKTQKIREVLKELRGYQFHDYRKEGYNTGENGEEVTEGMLVFETIIIPMAEKFKRDEKWVFPEVEKTRKKLGEIIDMANGYLRKTYRPRSAKEIVGK